MEDVDEDIVKLDDEKYIEKEFVGPVPRRSSRKSDHPGSSGKDAGQQNGTRP